MVGGGGGGGGGERPGLRPTNDDDTTCKAVNSGLSSSLAQILYE